jgi:trimeric autotransporter adhesin
MSRHVLTLLLALAMGSSLALQAADISLGTGVTVEPLQSVSLPISLTNPAAEGGVLVTLTSSDASVLTIRPSTIFIPAGSTVPYGLPQVSGVNFGAATVSAAAYGLSGDSQLVRVSASLLGPTSATIQQGMTQNITLSLSSPSPSAVTITLSSENPGVATVPAAIIVPVGGTLAIVPVTGSGPGSTVIHAGGAAFGPDKTINVSVTAPGMITLPGNVTVNAGQSAAFPVTLSTPAPPSGVLVDLKSSDPARVTVTPSSVFIAGGAVSPGSQPRVNALNIGGAVITASAPGYLQASQAVAVPVTITFSPTSLTLTGPSQGKLLLALSAPSPWGIGLTVQLTSSNPNVATVQPSIDIYPDGSEFTTVVVIVTPQGPGTAIISASAPPYIPAVTATVTVAGAAGPPASVTANAGDLQSAAVNTAFSSPLSATVRDSGGNPVPGVTVTFTAPPTGAGGNFAGPNTAVTNASGVATSPTFSANGTRGVYAVTASVPGVSPSAIFTLTNTPVASGAITLTTNVSTGPSLSVAFPVSLTVPAPPSGVSVTLSSSDPSTASISPASVFIAGGATAPAIQPQVTGVNFGSATISATAAGYSSASQLVQIKGSLSLTPSTATIRGTGSQTLALALSAPAPASGLSVSITSSNTGVITVGPNVLFGPGASNVTVTLTAIGFGSATITASSATPNVTGATASMTVQPASDITIGTGVTVEPGESALLPVSLALPAPAGGVYVTLASSNPGVLDIKPSPIVIREGSTVPARLPQVNGFQFGSATISASAYGLAGDSQTVLVLASLSGPASATIDRGSTQNVTFAISNPAPSALAIALSSDNPAIATVPASVTIPANGTVAFIPVTGAGAGSTTIHLGGPLFAANKILNVTVVAPGTITLLSNVTVNEGQSAPYPVTLGSPAPVYGVNVTLTSSDPARISVSPSVVFFPVGAVTPASQPQVNGVNIGAATITASAPGYLPATQSVAVPATVTFSPTSLTLTGSGQGKLLLALSAPSPWGIGLTVQLTSSDPSVATLQPSVNFYPDGSAFTTVVVIVTPHGRGTTIIHASAPPFIADTTATVTVQ